MIEFIQHIVNGLSVGAIYALIALGYTMVYGVLQLINFANGDVLMVGAMLGYYIGQWTGFGARPSYLGAAALLVMAMVCCGVLGFFIERFAYRPLRDRPRINALITAIGISFLLEYGGQLVFHPGPFAFNVVPYTPPLQFGGLYVSASDIIALGLAVALMLTLQWIVFRTRVGMAMRAISHDPNIAALMGVNTDLVISFTFVLGAVLASAAGMLYATKYHRVDPLMGLLPGLKAFVAAVLGGIGNVPGAMAGGILLGLVEELVAGYTSSSYRDAIAFGILILVLLVKPAGLFGSTATEKV